MRSLDIKLSDKNLQEITDRVNSRPLWDKTQDTPLKIDAFEKIDPSLLKGILNFKPFYKKLPKNLYEKYDINTINKTYTDCAAQTAKEATQDSNIQKPLEWLLQLISAFEPEKLPEEILKEANIEEQRAIKTGCFLRALISYQDLSAFSTVFGNATKLSEYMNKCAQMIKAGKDTGNSSSLCTDPCHINRFNMISQNSSAMLALIKQYYPVYEKKIITALS